MSPAARRALPSLVTGARLGLTPLLVARLLAGADRDAAALLALAALTDVADGALARRLGVASPTGAWLDVWADFLLVLGGLGALAVREVLPSWLVAVPVAVFGAFLLTSGRPAPRYDPVGKAYGGMLVGAMLISLLLPDAAVHGIVVLAVSGLSGVVLLGRIRLVLPGAGLALSARPPSRAPGGPAPPG